VLKNFISILTLDSHRVSSHLVFSVELYESSENCVSRYLQVTGLAGDFRNQHASLDHM
jgi:hypothetical protein